MANAEWLKADAQDYGPEAGEYSWGPGIVPSGLENEPPNRGGPYRGRSPKTPDHAGLRALADELDERHARGAS
jgi:hypothetical protein